MNNGIDEASFKIHLELNIFKWTSHKTRFSWKHSSLVITVLFNGEAVAEAQTQRLQWWKKEWNESEI